MIEVVYFGVKKKTLLQYVFCLSVSMWGLVFSFLSAARGRPHEGWCGRGCPAVWGCPWCVLQAYCTSFHKTADAMIRLFFLCAYMNRWRYRNKFKKIWIFFCYHDMFRESLQNRKSDTVYIYHGLVFNIFIECNYSCSLLLNWLFHQKWLFT